MCKMINAMPMPNYDIISIFENDNHEIITTIGNFRFFIEKQKNINAPGKVLQNINLWLDGKFKICRLEWMNGVCLDEDYIYNYSNIISKIYY